MAINLPEPLQQAVEEQPDVPIRVVDPRTNAESVLIRAEVYDQLGKLVDLEPRDVYPLNDEAFREGWSWPNMAEYDNYKSRKRS